MKDDDKTVASENTEPSRDVKSQACVTTGHGTSPQMEMKLGDEGTV